MASNARRPPLRTRTTGSVAGSTSNVPRAVKKDAAVTGTDDAASGTSSRAASGASSSTLGTRKRAALGDLTNANRSKSAGVAGSVRGSATDDKDGKGGLATRSKSASVAGAAGSKVPRAESSAMAGRRTTASSATTAPASRVPSRRTTTTTTTASRTVANGGAATRPTAASRARQAAQQKQQQQQQSQEEEVEDGRDHKRVKVNDDGEDVENQDAAVKTVGADDATGEAKDQGWEDLDAEDADDPLMVAEYVNEIFAYMKDLEMTTMPNGSYMDTQGEIDWGMRGVLVDWLIDTHSKFRMLPETLFLALNVVDRFLTTRAISLNKLQLVGLTAMFIAAKYEEVLCPSVSNFLYLADGGYDTDEILKAERYMLKVLGFNLSYANPMNFLRRISKADNYDIQTRTVAKYFMEISLVDYRLLEHPPSLIAAASIWMARKVLERGPWTPTLVHYSSYSEYELLGTAEIMLDYTLRPIAHPQFHKKYAAKKFMRASNYVVEWARTTYPDAVVPESDIDQQDLGQLRVDLFGQEGLVRPTSESCAPSEIDGADEREESPL